MDGSVKNRERSSGLETTVRKANRDQSFMKYSGVCQAGPLGAVIKIIKLEQALLFVLM
jgi:hypothetical protein